MRLSILSAPLLMTSSTHQNGSTSSVARFAHVAGSSSISLSQGGHRLPNDMLGTGDLSLASSGTFLPKLGLDLLGKVVRDLPSIVAARGRIGHGREHSHQRIEQGV